MGPSRVDGSLYTLNCSEIITVLVLLVRPSWWPRTIRLASAAIRLTGLRVRIPPGAWMSFCCERCVLSGRALYIRLNTNPEKSYRVLVCVW